MTAPVLHFPRGPIEVVLSLLPNAKKNASGWIAPCPAHEDRSPSLSVSVGDNGNVLLHCHAGCDTNAIVAAMQLSPRDLFPPRPDRPVTAGPTIVATYDYQDADGQDRFQVVRMLPKDFRQRHRDTNGEWIWTMKGVERVLYRLPELLAAKAAGRVIFLVEGEKDVDNLRARGFVATTNPGGAKKWLPAYTETLRGAKVVLIPDNDKAGIDHRDLVAGHLLGAAAELRVIDVPAPHKDISNWLEDCGTAEALKHLVQQTPLYVAAPPAPEPVRALPAEAPPPKAPTPPPPTQEEKPKKFARSDLGNAERMISRHGQDLHFVPDWRSWLVWDGRRWQRDKTLEAVRRATDTVRSMYDDLRTTLIRTDEREEILKFIIKSESEPRLRGMLTLSQGREGVPIEPSALDANPYLLTVGNGTLDLKSGLLTPYDRGHLITKASDVSYDPDAECPTWLAFLDRIFDGKQDLIRYLQTAIGYALTGSTDEQCFFFLYGTGANGKTTLLEILRELVGDYATQADFNTFLERKNSDGPRNDIARLFSARLVTSSEVGEGKRFDESLVKSLTGSEKVAARFLYADLFEFTPTFKLFLAANHKPVIRGTDIGIWRRIRLIPFTVQIPPEQQDKDLRTKLRKELPGILAWAVAGCQLWLEEGTLHTPADVIGAGDAYRVESDTLGAFLADHCEINPEYAEPATPLYQAYKRWADNGNEFAINQTRFGRQLDERGIVADKRGSGSGRKVWRVGIRLLNQPDSRSQTGTPGSAEERFF